MECEELKNEEDGHGQEKDDGSNDYFNDFFIVCE